MVVNLRDEEAKKKKIQTKKYEKFYYYSSLTKSIANNPNRKKNVSNLMERDATIVVYLNVQE